MLPELPEGMTLKKRFHPLGWERWLILLERKYLSESTSEPEAIALAWEITADWARPKQIDIPF